MFARRVVRTNRSLVCAIVSIALYMPVSVWAANYRFVKIADVTDFSLPSINDAGEVVFGVQLSNSGRAIYLGSGGPLNHDHRHNRERFCDR